MLNHTRIHHFLITILLIASNAIQIAAVYYHLHLLVAGINPAAYSIFSVPS